VRAIAFLATVFLLLSACAPVTQRVATNPELIAIEAEKQREIAIWEWYKDVRRLYYVSYPVLVGGYSLCKDKNKVSPQVGAGFNTIVNYPEEFRSAATTVFGETEEWRVSLVAPNSPADVAGLQVDDILISLDGKPPPGGNGAVAEFNKLYEETTKKKQTFSVDVRRGEETLQLTITSEMGCSYPITLANSNSLNAFADGKSVFIMRGMVHFASSDMELSTVIAHELAHNVMGHIEAKRGNAMLGTLADILALGLGLNTQGGFGRMAGNAYSEDFEAEADYVGLYIMGLSGLEIEEAAYFWRRMAAANPQAIQPGGFLSTHPSTPERFLSLENTVVEIKRKQMDGKSLRPEMRQHETSGVAGQSSGGNSIRTYGQKCRRTDKMGETICAAP
jgi:hypothetical protein